METLEFFLLIACLWWSGAAAADVYVVDDTGGMGRVFDGIGGLSGGGATSRLLVSYPEKQRDEILDYLFLPNFAAALHILKVEIGGDAQSTDGTEPSHMHDPEDENYQRGYEWWLMTEAKKRNPDIKLYGLSWAFPSWVGKGSGSPYTHSNITAGYIIKWIQGAKTHYNLTIDYVGIWNERAYNSSYIKALRSALDAAKLRDVQIVAADGDFKEISQDVVKDSALSKAVQILGAHYPGTNSTADAIKSGKQLWASEDYSTFNNDTGAGCWARILNQNYVTGQMTSTISWNLIASYYPGLPFYRDGLMTATEPWSGHYEENGPIWISAHTTQFTQPGYRYLAHGKGCGYLKKGGSYVTFYDTKTSNFTIVIETMTHNNSVCIRPKLPPFKVEYQRATFQLKGNLSNTTILYQWNSFVNSGLYFQKMPPIVVKQGTFFVDLPPDTVSTISTFGGREHTSYGDIPDSSSFPIPYSDDFENYTLISEARYFADQTGVFEITELSTDPNNKVMRQVITSRPITWCNDANSPITVIGNVSWLHSHSSVLAKLESENTAVFIAGGVTKGGCDVAKATGIFGFLNVSGSWAVTSDLAMTKVLASGVIDIQTDTWYHLDIEVDSVRSNRAVVSLDKVQVTVPLPADFTGGYVGFGTGGFYTAQFDNFTISYAR